MAPKPNAFTSSVPTVTWATAASLQPRAPFTIISRAFFQADAALSKSYPYRLCVGIRELSRRIRETRGASGAARNHLFPGDAFSQRIARTLQCDWLQISLKVRTESRLMDLLFAR